jgi:hypothetical protein
VLLLGLAAPAQADEAALQRCRGVAEAAARLACYDAIVVRPAAVAASAPVAERFGLPAAAEAVDRIESRINGRFEGWRGRDRIRLANGQVWQVVDDSTGVYWLDSPRVVVRRGALGSFVLEIEGANRAPRVRRVE